MIKDIIKAHHCHFCEKECKPTDTEDKCLNKLSTQIYQELKKCVGEEKECPVIDITSCKDRSNYNAGYNEGMYQFHKNLKKACGVE